MRKINDKKELIKLLSFISMGDGGLYKDSNTNEYKFVMNMKKDNEDYIDYCIDILNNLVKVRKYDRKDYNQDGYNRKPQIRIESRVHPILTLLHERIYTDKYKGLDPHALKMLDWECLAILFMSDGSTCFKGKRKDRCITLNMKRLSYGDQLLLKKALKDNLDLEWNIQKQNQYYYLCLRTKDHIKFLDNITPYILPSFAYKTLYEYPSKEVMI